MCIKLIKQQTHMSAPNLGYEDGDQEDILFYPPLPPHLEPPLTSFLGFTQQDLSFLFPDDCAQNSPNPLVEDDVGQVQENEKGLSGEGDEKETSSSCLKRKKMDHNEKERVRRINLNNAYLALRSTLPESHKPKKKWSAAYLIDRAVDHIPRLEDDIKKLESKKKGLLLEQEKIDDDLLQTDEAAKQQRKPTLSICINEVERAQLILQICHQTNKVGVFSELLEKLENEGVEVLNSSVLYPCENRSSHHIHVQVDESSYGAEYVGELKEKLTTWLS